MISSEPDISAAFMIVVILSLIIIIKPWLMNMVHGQFSVDPIGITGLLLLLLAFFILMEGAKILFKR